MSSRNKTEAAKTSLASSGSHQLKSLEREIQKCQVSTRQKGWNYSDFVARLLEVLVVLRLREERERDTRGK